MEQNKIKVILETGNNHTYNILYTNTILGEYNKLTKSLNIISRQTLERFMRYNEFKKCSNNYAVFIHMVTEFLKALEKFDYPNVVKLTYKVPKEAFIKEEK